MSAAPLPLPLPLQAEERELLAAELRTLLPALGAGRGAHYEALAAAVEEGEVPAESLPTLESMLELGLQTGRVRKLYKAEGERVLTGLLRRTPRGRALSAQLAEVNTALTVLAGETLNGVTVRLRTLGHYTVTIAAEAAGITLAIRPDGVQVEAVAVGDTRQPGP